MAGLKIGILTFHSCINYGSYWQARCLAEGLQARGHHVEILDHYSAKVNFAEWRCAFQPVLPTPTPRTDFPLYKEKIRKFFRAFKDLPLSAPFPLAEPEKMDHYDLVVAGSDEVWNLLHPWYGKCPLFYGDGLKADRLISYAASFGNYDASWGLEQGWADKLRNFSVISIRDENSRTIIQNALGLIPEMVLDPCLQFPVNPDKEPLESTRKPYIAVYGHNFSETYSNEIRNWAAARQLNVISIGYRNDWANEQWITAGPQEFARFIAGAEAVATNFFHGCVFALINKKPFVCENSYYRSNKVEGLMTLLGGENHLVTDQTPSAVYQATLNQSIAPEIFRKLELLQQTSDAFLDQAISVKQFQVA